MLFRTAVLQWIRAPLAPEDTTCHLCNGVLDRYGDHCALCPNGGDRNHNHLRNYTYHYAASAGLHPELERPGLLQPRPYLGSTAENGTNPLDPSARRPADVYLPRWRLGLPLAMDFAVTSGHRQDLQNSIDVATAATTIYEDYKRNHLDTAALCAAEGITFAPMVVETNGHWGLTAQRVFTELANTKSTLTGESREVSLHHLHQGLGTLLHRENARAVLKRFRTFTHNLEDVVAAGITLAAAATDAS